MEFITFLSQNYLNILGLGGYVIAGILAFLGIFNVQLNSRRKENEALTNELITKLDRKVKDQAEEIELVRQQTKDHAIERDNQIRALQDDIKTLSGKNELLENLFKGRDPIMQTVFKEAPEIFAIARENNIYSKANNVALTELTQTIKDFIATLRDNLIIQ